MDADEIALWEQIEAHKKRLRILEVRAATTGLNTPPEVIIEIEKIQNAIQILAQEAGNLSNKANQNSISNSNLKYYVYFSDTKVDMLYPQLIQDDGTNYISETRFSKLRKIIDILEKMGEIDTIDNPKMYFKGTLLMHWEQIRGGFGTTRTEYFTGQTDHTILGLGGSSVHIIGDAHDRFEYFDLSSNLSRITIALQRHMMEYEQELISKNKESYPAANKKSPDVSLEHVMEVLLNNIDSHKWPIANFEFVAKRLFQSSNSYRQYLLGTPLYVALAD